MNVLLAKTYDPDKHDPTGWLLSEKLDGVRAVWDGSRFVSRNGKEFDAPYRLTSIMPRDLVLDGELYLGRQRFNEASGIVRRHGDEWFGITYQVFDAITAHKPFHVRLAELRGDTRLAGHSFIQLVEQSRVESHDHLMEQHAEIVAAGGEGLIIRDPNSAYEFKRSSSMLKVKGWHELEAECVGVVVGKGKYIGMIGALECKMPDGQRFQCGSGLVDAQRGWATECFVGKQITVKFFELTPNGVPRFPIFKAVRDYE